MFGGPDGYTRDNTMYLGYTAQTGFPYFDSAVLITNRNWYYDSALESMRGHQTFRCHLVNIGPSCKQ